MAAAGFCTVTNYICRPSTPFLPSRLPQNASDPISSTEILRHEKGTMLCINSLNSSSRSKSLRRLRRRRCRCLRPPCILSWVDFLVNGVINCSQIFGLWSCARNSLLGHRHTLPHTHSTDLGLVIAQGVVFCGYSSLLAGTSNRL